MIIYVYTNGYDHDRDRSISKLARRFKGHEEGAGTDLMTGVRDMSFSFTMLGRATRFARAVRRLDLPRGLKVTKVGTYVERFATDGTQLRSRWVPVK